MKINITSSEYDVDSDKFSETYRSMLENQEIAITINGIEFKGLMTHLKWKAKKKRDYTIEQITVETTK